MKVFGIMSTAVLSLTLGVAAPALAQQEQHDQQEEQRDKPAQDKEKKAQPERTVKPEEKGARPHETNTKPAERKAQAETNSKPEENRTQEQRTQQVRPEQQEQHAQPVRPEQQAQRAGDNDRGRIPEERFRTNFGQGHRFRVSQNDYRSHRFEYGGYAFGFVGAWPSNWLYTEDVYVVEINGAYYLCNSMYPGVNIELNIL